MDVFEENLAIFEGTNRGSEMKESLSRCFNVLINEALNSEYNLSGIEKKISELEKGR